MFHFSTKAICFANIFPNTAPIDTKLNIFVMYASRGVEQKYSYMKHQKFEFCRIPRTWPNLLRFFSFREGEP